MTEFIHGDVIETKNRISDLIQIVDPEIWLAEGPGVGSQWEATASLSNGAKADAVNHVRSLGLIDQMRGLVATIGDGTFFTGFTVARAVLEAASYRSWIWEPGIAPEERLCRCLLEMKHDQIKERDFWGGLRNRTTGTATQSQIDNNYDYHDKEVSKLRSEIRSLKNTTTTSLSTERPPSSRMVAIANESFTGVVNDRVLYSVLSGAVHQSTTTLINVLSWHDEAEKDSIKVIDYIGPILVATYFYIRAMGYLLHCYDKFIPTGIIDSVNKFFIEIRDKHINKGTFVYIEN